MVGIEREWKFLVSNDGWQDHVGRRIDIVQGYLCITEGLEVRVRTENGAGSMTVKGQRAGDRRPEYKAKTEPGDAERMLEHDCLGTVVRKVRHEVQYGGRTWEIDIFLGENEGLVLAEVELPEGEAKGPSIPEWVGEDVTNDERYYNSYLTRFPFSTW